MSLLTLACGQAPAAGPDTSALVARLRGCGLLTEGVVPHTALDALYAPDACYVGCLAEGSCDELASTICDTSIALRLRCDARCAHACTGGALIANSRVCDGTDDCADGSDEMGCAVFTCDGRTLSIASRCNGYAECSDGSDEALCPGTCHSAVYASEVLVRYYRCDGWAVCADGNDEAGCGTFTCDAGYVLRFDPASSPLCDGYSQCGDGSDERGCPVLARLDGHCG